MPIYEFQCENDDCEADARIEKEISMSKVHDGIECPFCSEPMRKVYSSVPAIHFRGTGFYSTDSK
jgi:putative FmdB family regulatory protein